MVETILNISQPITCGIFLVAGACCFLLGKQHQGTINIMFFIINFVIFYGGKWLK